MSLLKSSTVFICVHLLFRVEDILICEFLAQQTAAGFSFSPFILTLEGLSRVLRLKITDLTN